MYICIFCILSHYGLSHDIELGTYHSLCFLLCLPTTPRFFKMYEYSWSNTFLSPNYQYGPPHAKNQLTGKVPDAGKDWGQEEKGTTEAEMVGWHHRLHGHESEQAPGAGDGQGGLACCSPWGCRVRHNWVTELNWTIHSLIQVKNQDSLLMSPFHSSCAHSFHTLNAPDFTSNTLSKSVPCSLYSLPETWVCLPWITAAHSRVLYLLVWGCQLFDVFWLVDI